MPLSAALSMDIASRGGVHSSSQGGGYHGNYIGFMIHGQVVGSLTNAKGLLRQ